MPVRLLVRRSKVLVQSRMISSPNGTRMYPGLILTIHGSNLAPLGFDFGTRQTLAPHTTPHPWSRRLCHRSLVLKYSCSRLRSSGVINCRGKYRGRSATLWSQGTVLQVIEVFISSSPQIKRGYAPSSGVCPIGPEYRVSIRSLLYSRVTGSDRTTAGCCRRSASRLCRLPDPTSSRRVSA